MSRYAFARVDLRGPGWLIPAGTVGVYNPRTGDLVMRDVSGDYRTRALDPADVVQCTRDGEPVEASCET